MTSGGEASGVIAWPFVSDEQARRPAAGSAVTHAMATARFFDSKCMKKLRRRKESHISVPQGRAGQGGVGHVASLRPTRRSTRPLRAPACYSAHINLAEKLGAARHATLCINLAHMLANGPLAIVLQCCDLSTR